MELVSEFQARAGETAAQERDALLQQLDQLQIDKAAIIMAHQQQLTEVSSQLQEVSGQLQR